LRKLHFACLGEAKALLTEVKQLSQLRELDICHAKPEELECLCLPPHALQLQCLHLSEIADHRRMSAMLHLPTLTSLELWFLQPDAWALLPQLPLLRRLEIEFEPNFMTPPLTSLMCSALSRCVALVELTLPLLFFPGEHHDAVDAEVEQRTWTELLRSTPHLRSFAARVKRPVPFLRALQSQLPALTTLSLLSCFALPVTVLQHLAHPTLQQVTLKSEYRELTQAQQGWRAQLIHSAQLPQLDACNWAIIY
jgi:hypothetical protein